MDVSTAHAAIEQINRLFTGVVVIAVIAAAPLSLMLQPRQHQIIWLSLGLVAGVVAQVLIGAVGQGFLGYFQYYVGVPAGQVAILVGISVAVWISALALPNAARISVTLRQFVLD